MNSKKVIWITGGGKGIGKSLSIIFAKSGYRVVVSGRNQDSLNSVVKIIEEDNSVGFAIVCNVSDENNVQSAYHKIINNYGSVDILINNAGLGIFKSIIETSADEFREQIETNLMGTYFCSKAVLPLMIEKKSGQIINIVSVAAIKSFTNSGTYGASKSAVLMLSKVLREEMKTHNIKVINVIPGATNTGIWNQKIRERYGDKMMSPDDVANVILGVCNQPDSIITEDIVLRPILGDLS